MPSDYPKDLMPTAGSTAIPYYRTIAFSAGFFTVLALLLIAMRFIPVAPAI